MEQEINTKDRILSSAIELFSDKGYAETSMRTLAERSGIKVSSLYNRYQSKEEILDSILQYYKEAINREKLPDDALEKIVMSYSPFDILYEGFRKIKEAAFSGNIVKIAKILLMEVYKNKNVRDFYVEFSLNENIESYKKLFAKMVEKKKIKIKDADVMASTYMAIINFFYYEYFIYKTDNRDTTELDAKIMKQIRLFAETTQKRKLEILKSMKTNIPEQGSFIAVDFEKDSLDAALSKT